jgi:hypothetical protein
MVWQQLLQLQPAVYEAPGGHCSAQVQADVAIVPAGVVLIVASWQRERSGFAAGLARAAGQQAMALEHHVL